MKNADYYEELATRALDQAHTVELSDAPYYAARAQVFATLAQTAAVQMLMERGVVARDDEPSKVGQP